MVTNHAVALKIVERYSHPGRTAYTYLFQLPPENKLEVLIPPTDEVVAAWIDEGDGLVHTPADIAVAHCQTTHDIGVTLMTPQKLTSQQRRQMMARAILFSVSPLSDNEADVHLVSRALAYSPKGDREVTEKWRHGADGWYSVYQPK